MRLCPLPLCLSLLLVTVNIVSDCWVAGGGCIGWPRGFVYLLLETWTAQRRTWKEAWRPVGLMIMPLYSPNRDDGEMASCRQSRVDGVDGGVVVVAHTLNTVVMMLYGVLFGGVVSEYGMRMNEG